LLEEYRFHPESKSGDRDGVQATRQTTGLLSRLHVRATNRIFIGKESNFLDDVEEGLISDPGEVYLEYENQADFIQSVRTVAERNGRAKLAHEAGLSEFGLRKITSGKSTPHRSTVKRLRSALAPFQNQI